jgi:hypothetical protein
MRRAGEPTAGLALAATADAATIPACVVRPEQTEGPYFIDEKLNRSDIRADPTNGSVSQGEQLRLAFRISRVDGSACKPSAALSLTFGNVTLALFGCSRHEWMVRYNR